MKILTVAIGDSYLLEAKRLLLSIGNDIIIFSNNHPNYVQFKKDPLIDGLFHKTNFVNYFPELPENEPILFCDADLFSLTPNPLESFKVNVDTDYAFVPYPNKWFFPDKIRQDAYDYFGYKINSGFMYFRNKNIAKQICNAWSEAYINRVKMYDITPSVSKFEYDEYALMIALMDMDIKIELLDKKWNDFELSTKEEMFQSGSIFFQSHDLSIH